MKKILFILLLIPAMLSGQTNWYVEEWGNDATGAGTADNPWRTLYKATSTVPSIEGDYGDVINIGSGTFTISNAPYQDGITLQGEGYNTHVISYVTSSTYSLHVSNSTGNTIYISDIRFDGNNTASPYGIEVYNADNVIVQRCFFENFLYTAIAFEGSTYRTGNQFINNTVTNCSGKGGDETYAVKLNRQIDFICDYNNIDETRRSYTTSGVPVGGLSGTRGLKLRHNTIRAHYRHNGSWQFAVELWYNEGIEIGYNEITGEVDLGGYGVYPGSYAYGAWIHHNIFGPSSDLGYLTTGVQIEQYCQKIIIEDNIFRNLEEPIYFCLAWPSTKINYADDITIRRNLMYGITGYSLGTGIRFESGSNDYIDGLPCVPPSYVDDLRIYHNTIVSSTASRGHYGILLPSQGRISGVTNLDVRNNIINGFTRAIYAYQQDNDYSQAIDVLNITYNDYYANTNNSAYFNGFTPTNYTSTTGIITTNPNFISSSDFHLQTGSGAIRAGTYISTVTTDLDGLNFLNPPSIGAYEYTQGASIPTITTIVISSITTTTAYSGGYISSDGGAAVTARGVCWSTSANPTTADDHTSDGTGTGSFTSYIEGLMPAETYHVRAYATNSVGTAYGSDRTFTAGEEPSLEEIHLFKHSGVLIKRNGTLLFIPY